LTLRSQMVWLLLLNALRLSRIDESFKSKKKWLRRCPLRVAVFTFHLWRNWLKSCVKGSFKISRTSMCQSSAVRIWLNLRIIWLPRVCYHVTEHFFVFVCSTALNNQQPSGRMFFACSIWVVIPLYVSSRQYQRPRLWLTSSLLFFLKELTIKHWYLRLLSFWSRNEMAVYYVGLWLMNCTRFCSGNLTWHIN